MKSGAASAAVAALAGVSLSWLLLLYSDLAWLAPTALAIAIPIAAGSLGRYVTHRPVAATAISIALTLVAGVIVVLAVTGTFTWDPRLWPGTLRTLADVGFVESDLFIAPTATTAGLLAITVGGALVLTWTMDTLTGTWQSPALALIPAVVAAMVGLVTFAGELPLWFAPAFIICSALVLATGRSPRTVLAVPGRTVSAPLAVITGVAAMLAAGIAVALPNDPGVWGPVNGLGRDGRLDLSVRLDAGQVNRGTIELLRYTVDGAEAGADDAGFLRLITYTTLEGDEWTAAEPGTYPVVSTSEPLEPPRGGVVVEDGFVRVYVDGDLVGSWPAGPDYEYEVATLLGLLPFPTAPGPTSRWRFIMGDAGITSLPVPAYAVSLQNSDGTDAALWQWRVDDRTLTRSQTTPVRYSIVARSSATSPAPDDRYIALPTAVSTIVAPYAQAVVEPGSTVRDAGDALVDYLTGPEFTYAVNVDYPRGPDHLRAFLEAKAGFCQQFATAMAAMARTVGIPSRLVVGFTAGREIADGEFSVTGSNLHAWVELYDPVTSRWLIFDPTPASAAGPGRTQDIAAATPSVTVTPTVTISPTAAPQPSEPPRPSVPTGQTPGAAVSDSALGTLLTAIGRVALVVFALALLIGAASIPALIRIRRRTVRIAQGSPGALWDELVDTARDLGVDVDRGMTLATATSRIVDHAEERDVRVHPDALDQIAALRESAERQRYARGPESGSVLIEVDPTTAPLALRRWEGILMRSATRWERLRARLLPRSLRA